MPLPQCTSVEIAESAGRLQSTGWPGYCAAIWVAIGDPHAHWQMDYPSNYIASSIAILDALADEQLVQADALVGDPIADVIRESARRHRARAEEMRAGLASQVAQRMTLEVPFPAAQTSIGASAYSG